ncbi:hypothetical protein QR78_05635 [Methylobacterium indicum]|nr:hypothetical protein QR78_05635 [Methylobacterium indicum]
MMGGPATFSLAQDIAFLVEGTEEAGGQEWHSSPDMRAKVFRVIEAALPTLLRANRPTKPVDIAEGIIFRAAELSRFLPEKPRAKPAEALKDARFVTDEELKRFFYLNEDNA